MVAYFLQVNVCWFLFYGVYYALLSKETFFRLNRLWLIASLLCGLALPFAADYFAVKVVPTHLFVMTLEPFVVTATALQQNITTHTVWDSFGEGVLLKVFTVLYVSGCAVLLLRFLGGLIVIFKLYLSSKKEKKEDFTLVITEGEVSPFSFFRFIFINPKSYEYFDYQQIMQHEKAHVRQRHSFDVLFLELLNILFWCSPLIYFYKTSLRNVHEYLADEAVLRQNTTPQYGRLLLRQRQSRMALTMTSNISNHFFSQLKKRILMMTRNKSKRTALIKYALAAPIFLILTAALASPKTPILAKTEILSDKVVTSIDKLERENLVQNDEDQKVTRINTSSMKEGEIMIYLDNLKTGGNLSESEIRNVKEVKAIQIIDGTPVECEITSFTMVSVPLIDDPIEVRNYSSKFNSSAIDILKKVKAGGSVYIFQIMAKTKESVNPRHIGSVSFLIGTTPQYAATQQDTITKPIADLKTVDEKQIAQMNIDSKEEWKTVITITFKDGHVERYQGTKAEFEQVFKKENTNQPSGQISELVVVGRSSQKSNSQSTGQNVVEEKVVQPSNEIKAEKGGNASIFTVVEQQPEFVGGMSTLFKWLGENIKYPKSARDAGAQGTVYVGFVIETDGSITNVNVKRDVPVIVRDTITITEVNGIKGNKIVERTEYSLGKEAVRVVSIMPKWKPGKSQGVPVRVAYTLPIKFKLE
ncbi:MAG: energy transducer TonB [Saprospiraceae bacterium]|nr:energy transducer TonB [Saprospiraceae bacterium]